MQLIGSVLEPFTVNPVAPALVTPTAAPVWRLVQDALKPPCCTTVYPVCCVSATVMGAVVVPPGKVIGKLTAPVESVIPAPGSTTPGVDVVGVKVHPTPGVASAVVPLGGTI